MVNLQEFQQVLVENYGPIIRGADIAKILGFPTYDAFRQSVQHRHTAIPLFTLPNRKGKFAHASQVAEWLVENSQYDQENNKLEVRMNNE